MYFYFNVNCPYLCSHCAFILYNVCVLKRLVKMSLYVILCYVMLSYLIYRQTGWSYRPWIVHVRPRQGTGPLERNDSQPAGTGSAMARAVLVTCTAVRWSRAIIQPISSDGANSFGVRTDLPSLHVLSVVVWLHKWLLTVVTFATSLWKELFEACLRLLLRVLIVGQVLPWARNEPWWLEEKKKR